MRLYHWKINKQTQNSTYLFFKSGAVKTWGLYKDDFHVEIS